MWDVKEHTHCSKRVGDVVPDVVVYHCHAWGGEGVWVRSKYELIAAASGAFTY